MYLNTAAIVKFYISTPCFLLVHRPEALAVTTRMYDSQQRGPKKASTNVNKSSNVHRDNT